MCVALPIRGVDHIILRWIRAALEGGWPRLISEDFPGALRPPAASHREGSYHISYGAFLSTNY